MPHYKDKKTGEIIFYESEKDKNAHLKFLKTPNGKKLGLDLDLEFISDEDRLKITNPPLTTEQRIREVRQRYDKEIKKVCIAHLFNDINSARNLSKIAESPLYEIAKQISDWEIEQQITFIAFLNDAENDIITINKSTFDNNFIQFKDI